MKFKVVRQHDSKDCGVACLATICSQYGMDMPLAKYREYTKTDNMGTNFFGLTEAGKQLGFDAEALSGDFESLLNAINSKEVHLPFIAHVIKNERLEYFIVVHKITSDKIIISDPGIGLLTISHQIFLSEWTGNIVNYQITENFRKYKENKRKLFFKLLKNTLPLQAVFFIFLYTIIATIIGIVTSFVYSYMIDGIVLGKYTTNLVAEIPPLRLLSIIFFTAIVLQLLKLLFDILRGNLVARLTVILDTKNLNEYYTHLLYLPYYFFSTKKNGRIYI